MATPPPPPQIRFSKHHKWNKAVAEAEALVGFPTSVDALQMIAANNDSSSSASMTSYIKKLMASDHPGRTAGLSTRFCAKTSNVKVFKVNAVDQFDRRNQLAPGPIEC